MQTPQPLARLACHRAPHRAPRLVRRRHVDLGRLASAVCRRG
ncbi:putative leader peptide [Streptomyces rhizoryzae]